MAVHIRLARHGTKKAPFYRIVVTDQRNARDGHRILRIRGMRGHLLEYGVFCHFRYLARRQTESAKAAWLVLEAVAGPGGSCTAAGW